MKGITGIGNASGLPPDIVEQLLEIEKLPIQTLEERKSKTESKLGLVNDLDGKVRSIKDTIGELASSRGFKDIKLISGDTNVVQGTVDPLVAPKGSWNIEVLQLAEKAAALSNGFPDKDTTEIGVGYISFDTAEGQKEVYISGADSTLTGVAAAINKAGVGIQASVIKDKVDGEYPWKLVLSGQGVGDENKINYPTVYMLDGDMDFYFEQTREAKNGKIRLDGIDIEVSANELDDMIPGVVLDLKQASPGRTVNVTVKEDLEVVTGKIETFVTSMNEVLSFIQQQNKLTEKSDTSRTLGGDQVLRTIEYRIRNMLQSSVIGTGSNLTHLSQIGISFNRDGLLEFNSDKFNSTLAKNPEAMQSFLAGDGFATGFIPKLRNSLNVILDSSFGPIANKRKGLQHQIERADAKIESIERNLVNKERTLRRKFASLEENMSRIKGQGALLQARMGIGGT